MPVDHEEDRGAVCLKTNVTGLFSFPQLVVCVFACACEYLCVCVRVCVCVCGALFFSASCWMGCGHNAVVA